MEKCIFCEIVKGNIPSEKVFENDYTYAFRDMFPRAPVHVLVIPKKHFSSLDDTENATDKDLAECLRAIRQVAMQEGLSNGYRVISNCGPEACQSVEHLHFHILAGRQMTNKIAFFMQLSECPKSERLQPDGDTYGYRWVYANLHIYIIRIKINGEYCKNIFSNSDEARELEYITEDWTIDEIRDAMTNKPIERIEGPARAFFDNNIEYFVGNHITGVPVFFCISIEDFKKSQLPIIKLNCDYLRKARARLASVYQQNNQ